MIVREVMLELTRKCTMRCAHCLRGPVQNINMPIETINKVFSMFDIDQLAITGGEPTLAVKEIEHIANWMRFHNRRIDHFFMVTNGKYITQKTLDDLEMIIRCCGDNELTQIAISKDSFHSKPTAYNTWEKWAEMMIYKYDLPDYFFTRHVTNSVIKMGNAITNGVYTRELNEQYMDLQLTREHDELCINEGLLYINVHGDIFNICDLSYKEQKNPKYKLGNVWTTSKDDLCLILENKFDICNYD